MFYREVIRHPEWYKNKERKAEVTNEILNLFLYGLGGRKLLFYPGGLKRNV